MDTSKIIYYWEIYIKKKFFTLESLKLGLFILFIISIGYIISYLGIPVNPEEFRKWILDPSRSNYAILIMFLINLLVIFFPFFPNFIVHIAAGYIFPFWEAFLIIYISSIIGWSINYYLAKKLGRGFVQKLIGDSNMGKLDTHLRKAGILHFALLINIPGMSYDVLGYIAGLIKIPYRAYFFGAIIGAVPSVSVAILQGSITQVFPKLGITLIIAGLLVTAYLASLTYRYQHNKKLYSIELKFVDLFLKFKTKIDKFA